MHHGDDREEEVERSRNGFFAITFERSTKYPLSLCWPCRGPKQGLDSKGNPKCFERAVAKYVGCERMVSTALVT